VVLVGATWIYATLAAALVVTWLLGYDDATPMLVLAAAIAPLVLLPSYAALAVAWWSRGRVHGRILLALTAALAVAQAVSMQTVVGLPHQTPHGVTVRILDANLRYDNESTAAFGRQISRLRPDVVTVEELSPTTRAGIIGALGAYPYRIEHVSPGAFGEGVYSRYPLARARVGSLDINPMIRVAVTVGQRSLPLVVVHTNAPRDHLGLTLWNRQFRELHRMVESLPADTVLVGDFNATLSNRPLRGVLSTGRLHDAALWAGCFWLRTWPRDLPVLPPLFELDHMLVPSRVGVRRFGLANNAGSDHMAIWADLVIAD
jgi:endonuclease/exonuclease/phosphatase (EEP) superfamily protein YafD